MPVALVTGATRGIGAEIARALLERKCQLVLTGRSPSSLPALPLPESERVSWLSLDVVEPSSVDELAQQISSRELVIDILVNNAGCGGGGPTLETSDDDWHQLIDTNLSGVWRVTSTLLKQSLLNRPGRILNIASTGGKQGVVLAPAYTASKHGVVGMTKSWALEYAKDDLRFNAVCPGFVETELSAESRRRYAQAWATTEADVRERQLARIPTGEYVMPSDVATLVAFLALDAPSSITGQAFNICGGLGTY